jgi:adenylate cyclase
MALWGESDSGGDPRDDALACIRSALMIRAVVSKWNDDRASYQRGKKQGEYNSIIKMGCGINIGEGVVGQIGSEERREYSVIGDAGTLSARMEGPNDLFDTDILISENIWDLIEGRTMPEPGSSRTVTAGNFLTVEEMDSLEVKGKEKPLRIFSVVNMSDDYEAEKILSALDALPNTGASISRLCVGASGPRNMADVRKCWRGFASADIANVNDIAHIG